MVINSLTITRTILHFALVSIAGFLTNYIIKNRKKVEIITKNIIAELEETNRRTEDLKASYEDGTIADLAEKYKIKNAILQS